MGTFGTKWSSALNVARTAIASLFAALAAGMLARNRAAARFRRAPSAERMRAFVSALAAGATLIARSPKRAILEAYRQQQEDRAREEITQFVARYARDS
jgi:hypothetical protein